MDTITLPDDLSLEDLQPVGVFDYCSSKVISRQQIILNQNTFSFLIEGTKEVVFDNSSLSIDNSKFLIMKSGHCLMTEKLSESSNYRSVLMFFTTEALSKFVLKYELDKNEPTKYKSVFSFENDRFVQGYVSSLLVISKLPKNIQLKLLKVKFEEIMLYLIGIYGTEFLYSLLEKSSDITQKFIKTIEANCFKKMAIKELAFLCSMSVSTFKREFEKQYAESPIKWFLNKRLEYAQHLLKEEQKKSSEIYLEVGYESLSSFIQAYKLKFGITPKQQYKN
ncbi:AraC family transcriptional regulator [Flavobacterium sp. LM5]|uniref:helix-turn-helix domain-containing protein n=1 Tax=Flavobacterium sp. LM5 TaxID=1938610 RepID=UPI0009922722|nr:AraC family transcriptional regulator [Flavobacterium sp. LM5]OOV16753.1 AraC family transcriptional regulator [Flavobacterium sp. LM5]OOV16754.1 AraC family transcriptional regulator [Flavobacterium sp. LM5]OOV27091.1 AraC family transcriptional regulator [Flavobacterium sp. LM5]